MYFDSAYIAKYYINEPDSPAVRELLRTAEPRVSSEWAIPEVTCVFRRHVREGRLSETHARIALDEFLSNADGGMWRIIPLSTRLLLRCSMLVSSLPASVHRRAGDAIHLTTAADEGESEIWTSDRHLLAAAPYFGLTGRRA